MKNIRIILSAVIAVTVVGCAVGPTTMSPVDRAAAEREAYAEYIVNHPYKQDREAVKGPAGKDRPGDAAEFEFLRTVDPALRTIPVDRLYAANEYGVAQLRQIDLLTPGTPVPLATETWVERGPDNIGGRTRAIMFDPNDVNNEKVWAGGVAGGLWSTSDITTDGVIWTKQNDFWENLAVTAMTHDPTDIDTFYVGTGEGFFNIDAVQGGGIFKSEDAGSTFTRLPSTDPATDSSFTYIQDIVATDTGTVLASTRGGGVQRSIDGGTSWAQVLTAGISGAVTSRAADLEIDANGDIYAALGIFSSGGIWKSTDDGATWTAMNLPFAASGNANAANNYNRIEICTAPSNSLIAYAFTQSATTFAVNHMFQTIDGGATWTSGNAPGTGGQAWYDLICAVNPTAPDDILLGVVELQQTTNGGTSWSLVTGSLHVDFHEIVYQPGSNSAVVYGNDGGIGFTTNINANPSATYINRNDGYNVTQYYGGDLSPTAGSNILVGGTQDNSTHYFDTAGIDTVTSPSPLNCCDGIFAIIDQDNPNFAVGGIQNGAMARSFDGGASYGGNAEGDFFVGQNAGLFIPPIVFDDTENLLYSSLNQSSFPSGILLVRNLQDTNVAPPLAALGMAGMASESSTFGVSPYNPGTATVFIGTEAGQVLRAVDVLGTNTVTDISGTINAGYVSSIEVGDDEDHLLVTLSNYGITSIYETVDGGTNWSGKDGDLPDIPVRWALWNPADNENVLIATESGLWETTNFGAGSPNWTRVPGFPTVRVDQLQTRSSDNGLAAITHGRGIWTSAWASGPPVANDDSGAGFTTDEDTSFTTTSVLDNDTDPEMQQLCVDSYDFSGTTGVFTPPGGACDNGQVGYDPNGQFESLAEGDSDTTVFGYTVIDEDDNTDVGVVTVTINGVNDAPTGDNDSFTVAEGGTATAVDGGGSLLANDSDPDTGDQLVVSQVTTAPNNSSAFNVMPDGTFTYTHDGSETTTDSFVYEVCDDASTPACDTATVSITITEVNDSVSAAGENLGSVAEDSAVQTFAFSTLLANDSPGPGETTQTLTITQVSSAVGGGVTINGTSVEFTPTGDFNGNASFVYTVTDDGTTDGVADPQSANATATLTITAVNDAPVAVDDSLTEVAEDSGVRSIAFSDLVGNDAAGPVNESGQTLTITAVDNAVGGSVVINGSAVEFTLNADFSGPASFRYTVEDDGQTNSVDDFRTDTGTASFTVTEVNDPVTANDENLGSIAEDAGLQSFPFATLLSNDDAGAGESTQVLTITSVSGAVGGVAVISGNNVEFTPPSEFSGAASFVYTVSDDGTTNGVADPQTDDATATLTVTTVNDPPVAADDDLGSYPEGAGVQSVQFATLLGNDSAGPTNESGQSLTVTAVDNPVGGSVAINGMAVDFVPDPDFSGTASFRYTVQDDGQTNSVDDFLTDAGTASFTVTEVNDPVTANDENLGSIAEDAGLQSFPFAILLSNDDAGAGESTQVLTITSVSGAVGGVAVISGNNVEFTPTSEFSGAASFVYTVSDDGTTNGVADPQTDDATATLTVTTVNDPPVAADDDLGSYPEGAGVQSVQFATLLGNDSAGPANESGQSLTVTAVDNPVGGSVAINGMAVDFVPDPDFSGTASFRYTVQDDGQTNSVDDFLTDTGTASFTVTEFNDPVTANGENLGSISEDSAVQSFAFATLLSNDDPGAGEGDQTLTITSVSNAIGGTAVINGNSVEFSATPDFNGNGSFTYTVSDDGTSNGIPDPQTADATATLTITEVNDAPVSADDELATIAEDAGLQTIAFATLLSNDSAGPANEAGQTLTVSAVDSAVGGTVSINAGAIEFTPQVDFNGPASFRYTAIDDGTTNGFADPQSTTAMATFDISEVNDPPVAADDFLADQSAGTTIVIDIATLLSNDAAGESAQTLTMTSVQNAANGTVSIVGGNVEFVPVTNNYTGPASFEYTVEDDGTTGGISDPMTDTATVSFDIVITNGAPLAVDDRFFTDVDETLVGDLSTNDSDPESDQLTYSVDVEPSFGSLVISGDGTFTYVPDTGYNGPDSFTYAVTDGINQSIAAVDLRVGDLLFANGFEEN